MALVSAEMAHYESAMRQYESDLAEYNRVAKFLAIGSAVGFVFGDDERMAKAKGFFTGIPAKPTKPEKPKVLRVVVLDSGLPYRYRDGRLLEVMLRFVDAWESSTTRTQNFSPTDLRKIADLIENPYE